MFTPKLINNARRSFATPRSSILTPRSRNHAPRYARHSKQSDVIEETSQHQLLPYGEPLPLAVSEVLASTGQVPSAHFDPSGWAWLTSGSKLLIWRYFVDENEQQSTCCEYQLPPHEISATSVSLVTILPVSRDVSAVVAALPEGVVRYWPKSSRPLQYEDISIDLNNEVCVKLITLSQVQCILGTSSSTLILLTPVHGQNRLNIHRLSVPHGMVSGLKRRVSSMFFGATSANPSPLSTAPLYQIAAGDVLDEDVLSVFALSGNHLIKWSIQGGMEKLVYQADVRRMMSEYASSAIWGQSSNLLDSMKVWLIDMVPTIDSVVVLGATTNPAVGGELHYMLGVLLTEGYEPPQSFLSFLVSRFTAHFEEDEEIALLGYRLVLPDVERPKNIYLYNKHSVLAMSVSNSTQPVDRVDFRSPSDYVLGAGCHLKQSLFLSARHGLVALQLQNERELPTTLNVSQVNSAPLEDPESCLLQAFMSASKKNYIEAQSLADRLKLEKNLDQLVVNLSQNIIDDYPASDPRWSESLPKETATKSSSLILKYQLTDKLKVHSLFVEFLKSSGLWERLTSFDSSEIPTSLYLCENGEKVAATLVLHAIHSQEGTLFDKAIAMCLSERGEVKLPPGLTAHDLFYRKVSQVDDIIHQLSVIQESVLQTDMTKSVEVLKDVNHVLISILREAWQFRTAHCAEYMSSPMDKVPLQHLSWTAPNNYLIETCMKQHSFTYEKGLASNSPFRHLLIQQLVDLTDLILSSLRARLVFLQHKGKPDNELDVNYQALRASLIRPLLKLNQHEQVAALAEKFLDFLILIELCEGTNNQKRLEAYAHQFKNQGFSELLFKYYMSTGKRGKLMTTNFSSNSQLRQFLHSGENQNLSWLHDLSEKRYLQAHATLLQLAKNERLLLSRKKTQLSLSKLAVLACEQISNASLQNIHDIDNELDLVLEQENLPESVIDKLALDPRRMQVMNPADLILIFCESEDATEKELKQAIDLLAHVTKEDVGPLKVQIWCQALLQNDWSRYEGLSSNSDLMLELSQTVVYRLAELVVLSGGNLKELMPPLQDIWEAERLNGLQDDKQFQYLVSAGYEHIQRSFIPS